MFPKVFRYSLRRIKFTGTKNLIASLHSGQFPPVKCQYFDPQDPKCVEYSPKKEGIGTLGTN